MRLNAISDSKKGKVKSAPVLAYYDVNELITVQVGACDLGTVHMQMGKPIAFAFKALDTAQVKFATIEEELLAECFDCNRFHGYIF